MEPYGALIRLKTAGQGEADRLIEHRMMNLSLNKTGRKTGMEEMKDEFMSEKELEDHVEHMVKLSEKDMDAVSGGRGINYYSMYAAVWKKVMGACMWQGYRKAKCPKCGAPLPKLTHAGKYGEEELKFAAENKLYCKHCGQASRDEEWVINKFN